MSATDLILRRLEEAGILAPAVPKRRKPPVVAFVDVERCIACGLCVAHCPAGCIETLPEGTVEGRDPQPVQVRFGECVGCHVCVELCEHVAGAQAVRTYDVNLVEQVMGVDVGDEPEPAGPAPEAWDEYWSEGGGFHHMGEGSRIASLLTTEDRAALAGERPRGA